MEHRDRVAARARLAVTVAHREQRERGGAGADERRDVAPDVGVQALEPEHVAVPADRAFDVADDERDVIDAFYFHG